jgi:hypothetical protein
MKCKTCGKNTQYGNEYCETCMDSMIEQEKSAIRNQGMVKFESLTEAYNVIVSARDSINRIKERIEQDFKSEDNLYSPFSYRHDLNEQVETARTDLTKFVIWQVGKEYLKLNIDLDDKAIHDFVEKQGYFNHIEILQFIREKYADVDAEALKQIKAIVKGSLLPVGNFGEGADRWATANKPEHIRMDGNSTGIELRVWGKDYISARFQVSALLKLIQITLNNVKPSQAKGIELEQGATYRDAKIKSLRYFKNNSLKLIFYQKPDADKVIEALLS